MRQLRALSPASLSPLRRASAAFGLVALWTASSVSAQVCAPKPPAMHSVAANYATAAFTGNPQATSVTDGTQTDVGPSYTRSITSPDLVGKGNFVLLEGQLLTGRLNVRDVPFGQADGPYLRIAGSGTVATDLSSLAPGLLVCGSVGLASTQYTGRYMPTRWIDVPIGVGLAVAIPIGGLQFSPFIMPSIGYFSAFYDANVLYARPSAFTYQAKDIALNYGATLRFGRIEIRALLRMKDQRVANTQWQLRSAIWF